MIAAPPLPPAPRYGEASLCELLPAAVTALEGGDRALLPWPERVRGVVVLVVDGLGRRQLDGRPDLAPLLTSAPVLHPDFIGSGLTRAALRGGHEVPAAGLEETLRTAAAALATAWREQVRDEAHVLLRDEVEVPAPLLTRSG